MKISVKEVGVGSEVNPYEMDKYPHDHDYFKRSNPPLPALDTNGNKLPIGEYEMELVWQHNDGIKWNNQTSKQMKLSPIGKNYSALFRQVYIASVAPDSNILHTDMTGVPLSPVDDYYKELGKRIMDEGVEPESKEVCPTCKGKHPEICSNAYHLKHGFQPEKEVDTNLHQRAKNAQYFGEKDDTIEQAAEKYMSGIYSKHLHGEKVAEYSINDFIAGANHIKQTHVPLASVITLIENYKPDIIDCQPQGYSTKEYLDIIVRGIKLLIKE